MFETIGIDYTGPLLVKDGDQVKKTYVLLFTCAVFRAVHLELLDDMSYDELMHGLTVFFARRGTPKLILSDNAKSFIKERSEIINSGSEIKWKMIPERAPWYGGFWERLMAVVKTPLRKTLGNTLVSKRKMITLLTQVESVVNDRPLTSMSSDCRDPVPLTPNHFLRGNTCDSRGFPNSITSFVDLPKEYKAMQTLLAHFCCRFRREYFTALRAVSPDLSVNRGAVGDVVLLPDTRSKCFNWPLGLIVKLFPGIDGVSRVALIKTRSSIVRRSIQGLVPLELRGDRELPASEQGVFAPDPEVPPNATDRIEENGEEEATAREAADNPRTRSGRVIQPVDRFY